MISDRVKRLSIGITSVCSILGCGDVTQQVSAPQHLTSPSPSKSSARIAFQEPGTIEVFQRPRDVNPRTAKLLDSRRESDLLEVAKQRFVKPRSEDVARSKAMSSSRLEPEVYKLLSAAAELTGRERTARDYRPNRTTHLIVRDGKSHRIAEYTYKGELLARIHLGAVDRASLTSTVPSGQMSRSISSDFRPARFQYPASLELEFYAETDSLTIDEVADYIALTYALESETDNTIAVGEEFLAELEVIDLASNMRLDSRPQIMLAASDCADTMVSAYQPRSLTQVTNVDPTSCLGRISMDLVGAGGVKALLSAARQTATQLLGRYIAGQTVGFAVGAGLVTGGSLVIAAGATIWAVNETINYCRSTSADYSPLQEAPRRSQQLAGLLVGRSFYS